MSKYLNNDFLDTAAFISATGVPIAKICYIDYLSGKVLNKDALKKLENKALSINRERKIESILTDAKFTAIDIKEIDGYDNIENYSIGPTVLYKDIEYETITIPKSYNEALENELSKLLYNEYILLANNNEKSFNVIIPKPKLSKIKNNVGVVCLCAHVREGVGDYVCGCV